MKRLLLLTAMLSVSLPAFATDLKCHGRAEPSDKEKNNIYAQDLNYQLTNDSKGYELKDFDDTNSTFSASSGKPLKEWKEGAMKVVGLPGVFSVYLHDRYHAVLAERRGGYDDVPEYVRYVNLDCE